ncbi:hypothetical protein Nepgr_017543 [Nepenthes gracilis]|uniref:SRR1-like domain-containing protein n=1 Tax=Nepenthes gracilis TaxID=150966 RepID=A0AAD3XS90_NEPGR|nr:hypothetical protein Nepgr_017543 [Nepenthes gracilis]
MVSAATEIIASENSGLDGGWTVVLPRHAKRHRARPKLLFPKQKNQSWAPNDLQIDVGRESKLMQKIQICMKQLESSRFFELFLAQIHDHTVLDHFVRVLHSEPKMEMVIYGIGSIECFESPRLQLCLAILMKGKFDWIGDIKVFDPLLSATECRVLEALGCSVLTVNEEARRPAVKPTLFFMPHCEAVLYNNLLEANWRVDRLRNLALFGNSFGSYEQHLSLVKDPAVADSRKYILAAAQSFGVEFRIQTVSDYYFNAFHESCWHFFSPDNGHGLPIV